MTIEAEEIKNRLSNIGEAIGNIALEYIADLEKQNRELQEQVEKMKCCSNCSKVHKRKEDGLVCCSVGSFHINAYGKGCKEWGLAE